MHLTYVSEQFLRSLELGVLLSLFLFGINTAQAYAYARKFRDDSSCLKTLVFATWFLDLAHTICIANALYEAISTDNTSNAGIIGGTSLIISLFPSSLVSVSVQLFFAARVRSLSHRNVIAYLCWILCFFRLCVAFVSAGVALEAGHTLSISMAVDLFSPLLTTALVLAAVTDVIIAVASSYYLSKFRDEIMCEGYITMLDCLIRWSIQTGSLTSVTAIFVVICYHAWESTFAFVTIYAFLTKLYPISLLIALHARTRLRQVCQNRSLDWIVAHELPTPVTSSSNSPIAFPSTLITISDSTGGSRNDAPDPRMIPSFSPIHVHQNTADMNAIDNKSEARPHRQPRPPPPTLIEPICTADLEGQPSSCASIPSLGNAASVIIAPGHRKCVSMNDPLVRLHTNLPPLPIPPISHASDTVDSSHRCRPRSNSSGRSFRSSSSTPLRLTTPPLSSLPRALPPVFVPIPTCHDFPVVQHGKCEG